MREKIRFHLDESVSNAIAEGLRRRGISVTTTIQVGLLAASDEEQLSFPLLCLKIEFWLPTMMIL